MSKDGVSRVVSLKSLTSNDDDAASKLKTTTIPSKIVSLGHVKKDDPKIELPPVPKRIMAWPGGKISSNKDEALSKFVEKLKAKVSKGIEITEAQHKIVQEWDEKYKGISFPSSNHQKGKRTRKESGKRKKPVLGPPVNKRFTGNDARNIRSNQNQNVNRKVNRKPSRSTVKIKETLKASVSVEQRLGSGLTSSR